MVNKCYRCAVIGNFDIVFGDFLRTGGIIVVFTR